MHTKNFLLWEEKACWLLIKDFPLFSFMPLAILFVIFILIDYSDWLKNKCLSLYLLIETKRPMRMTTNIDDYSAEQSDSYR